MKFQKIFEINLLKFIIAIIVLVVSAIYSNELFMVCKVGAPCTPPIFSYVSGIIFLIDVAYIIIAVIYTIIIKIRKIKNRNKI